MTDNKDGIKPMKFVFCKHLADMPEDNNDEKTIYFSWLDSDENNDEERG
jgi:hypothetical protein